jgi:hypothetical protein
MRKLSVLALAALLALTMASGVAQAKGKKPGTSAKKPSLVTYVFEGTIASVDGATSTVAVDVAEANKAAQSFVGGQVSFAVSESTKIELDETKATLGELAVGDVVMVQAKAPAGATSFTARILSAQSAPVVSEPSV